MKYIEPEMLFFEIEEEDIITSSVTLEDVEIGGGIDDADDNLDFSGGFTP